MPTKTPNPSKNSLTFNHYIETWLDYCRLEDLSPRTIKDYQEKVPKFVWWWETHTGYSRQLGISPQAVTVKEAREFAAYLKTPQTNRWGSSEAHQELSPASVVSYGRTIKVFFSWLEQEGHIKQNPFNKSVKFSSNHKKDTIIKNVSADKLAALFAYLTDSERVATFTGKRDLAIVSLLLDAGIRRGELLSLNISDLDIHKLRCVIRGKTGQRQAYFSEKCKGVLMDYLKVRLEAGADGPLWMTVEGEPLGLWGFNTIIRRLRLRSGVDFHAHQLRHTFALMMSSRVSVFELRDLLGHTSINTTQVYVQRNPERLADLHRPNSPLTALNGTLPGLQRRGRPLKWK
ncbi:MAG: tyrosine-type recombinase/integrase [Chloroflexi bacterium]|nr:tyrosine-type recombinase/integrase [Chloroflexota bacterium]OJV95167.1 MAG: hypothetical protein BGO39_24445 [Chloroflexi bacterium 54-19]